MHKPGNKVGGNFKPISIKMYKYKTFYSELRTFLIENELAQKSNIIEISEFEIDKLSKKIPLAYKEWLRIFGNVNCLLNFPYFEDYSLESLVELQNNYENAVQLTEGKKYIY